MQRRMFVGVVLIAMGAFVLATQSLASTMMPGWGMPGHMSQGMGSPMGWWGQSAATGSAPAAVANAPTFEIIASDFGFRPAQVRVRTGQTVNIALVNRGAIFHDITAPALQLQVAAQPGQRGVAGVPAARPGTYEFYCSVPGHREAGMVGRLVVGP